MSFSTGMVSLLRSAREGTAIVVRQDPMSTARMGVKSRHLTNVPWRGTAAAANEDTTATAAASSDSTTGILHPGFVRLDGSGRSSSMCTRLLPQHWTGQHEKLTSPPDAVKRDMQAVSAPHFPANPSLRPACEYAARAVCRQPAAQSPLSLACWARRICRFT